LFQELPTSFIYAEIGLLVPGCHKEKSLCDDMVGKVKKKKNYKSCQGYDRYGNISYGPIALKIQSNGTI